MNSIVTAWGRGLLVLVLLGCAVIASPASAQMDRVANYNVTTFTGGLANLSALTAYLPNQDDATLSFGLPFDFYYDDAKITAGTTMYMNTNIWASFGINNPGATYRNFLGSASVPNTVMPFHCDGYVYGGMRLGVAGAAPNRILIIEWDSVRRWSASIPSDAKYTKIQAWFYENTNPLLNIIEFRYRDYNYDWLSPHSTEAMGDIGLNGKTTPNFSYKTYQTGSQYSPSANVRFTPVQKPDQRLALSPEAISFGNLLAGEVSPTYAITVTNVGLSTNLVVNSASISGVSDFTIVSAPSSNTYLPGQSGTYLVRFSPQNSGQRTATFNLTSNGLDSGSQSVSLTGFGIAPGVEFVVENNMFRKTRTRLGDSISQSFIIKSVGNGPLTVTSITPTGEYASMYSVTRRPTLIPSGTHDTVTVTFSPTEEGLRPAVLDIRTNALNNPNRTVQMFGTGILQRLMVTPTVVNFDSVAIGDTAWATIRLDNVGSDTLAVKEDYFAYADKDFTYIGLNGADSLIYPERFREVQVRFTPTTRGHRTARLRLLTNIPRTFETVRRDTSEYNVDIFGVGVPYGQLAIDGPASIDSVLIGSQICHMVRLENSGETAIVIDAASINGPDAADFTLNNVTYPITIEPKGFREVELCATPSARGLRSAMIDVSATSGERSTITQLPLIVYGLLACGEPDGNTAFVGQTTKIGLRDTATVTITNCGDVPMNYSGVVTGAGYSIIGNASSGDIMPGATHTYTIQFTPSLMDLQQGTLTVSADNIQDIEVDLMGIGGGIALEGVAVAAPPTMVGESSAEYVVSVRNNGNMDFDATGAVSSSTEFQLVSAATSIAAGATEDFRFVFTPSQAGTRSAFLSFADASAGQIAIRGLGVVSSVRKVADKGYELMQNYPNPVSGRATISFTMAEAGKAMIVVSDLTGNVVAVVADSFYGAGLNEVEFNATNLASGTYFYELVANGVRLQRTMMLSK